MKEHPLETLAIASILILLLALLAVATITVPAGADTHGVMAAYVGANGAWFSEADPYQADFEPTATLSASLSPHISIVGSAAWGVCNSYVRGATGARITVTDVNNPDFSVGVGCQYRIASKAVLRPNEWSVDVSMGFRPVPEQYPNLLLVGQGYYGLDTHRAGATVGARWRFPL